MRRSTVGLALLLASLVPACRSDSAAVTTTSSTRPPLGVVIAQCRVLDDTVTLLNQANSARNLDGWTIHDEGREHVLPIGSVLLDHTRTVVFMSGPDAQRQANTRGEIAWTNEDVWDDNGDTAYLLNRDGDLVDQRLCT